MWVLFAFGSALFAGLTAVLAKLGLSNIDSDLATAIRMIIIVMFSWLMVLLVGSFHTISQISSFSFLFLILSGIATGLSWIFYFHAIQIGDINKVVPIDKASIILTMLFSFIFLKEPIDIYSILAMILIGSGTFLMIQKKEQTTNLPTQNKWLLYAILSSIFASLTSILGKIGIEHVDSHVGTAIRSLVVFIMAWLIVFMKRKQIKYHSINLKNWVYLLLSGLTTGLSWLCYYRALQDGYASIVAPIDKLSILISILFAYFILKEKLTLKAGIGLIFIVIGTFLLLI